MPWVVTNDCGNNKYYYKVNSRQQKPQQGDSGEMFVKKVIVLGNVTIVKTCNSEIKKNIEKECKIENCKIKTIFTRINHILNCTVDAKNPEWLHQ
jgi:hypothetical protein